LSFPALAATTVSFSPASVSVNPGQSFNLTINVDPQAVKNYTAKIELHFPADLLEVTSFNFDGSGWMAWNQPGYDLTDNTNGILIKTAGYPGGFNSPATFGTVSFSAKKAGSGTIQTGSNCLTLDANNQNVFSGTVQTNVTIALVPTPPPATPTPRPSPTQISPRPTVRPTISSPSPTPTLTPTPTETPTLQPSPTETPLAQAPVPSKSLFAGIGNLITWGTGSAFLGIIAVLVIILIVVYIILVARKSRRDKIK